MDNGQMGSLVVNWKKTVSPRPAVGRGIK